MSAICVALQRMMQDVHVKLNSELPRQKQHSTRRKPFYHQKWLKFKEEIDRVLQIE